MHPPSLKITQNMKKAAALQPTTFTKKIHTKHNISNKEKNANNNNNKKKTTKTNHQKWNNKHYSAEKEGTLVHLLFFPQKKKEFQEFL